MPGPKYYQMWQDEFKPEEAQERTFEEAVAILTDGSGPIYVSEREFVGPDDSEGFLVVEMMEKCVGCEQADNMGCDPFDVINPETDNYTSFRDAVDALLFAGDNVQE